MVFADFPRLTMLRDSARLKDLRCRTFEKGGVCCELGVL